VKQINPKHNINLKVHSLIAHAYFCKYLLDYLMASSGPLFIYFIMLFITESNYRC